MMPGRIAGILFDKDGVFVDFELTWKPALKSLALILAAGDDAGARRLLEAAGFDADRDVFLPGSVWAAGNTRDLVEAWEPSGDAAARAALIERVEAHCAASEPASILALDQLRAVLGELHGRRYRLGLATNDAHASAVHTLERFGIASFFDVVMGYDSVERPKPAPDPVWRFCEFCGIEAKQVAMVGDNAHDMEMGRAGGVGLRIGVLSGTSTQADLEPLADHVIADISELPALLSRVG